MSTYEKIAQALASEDYPAVVESIPYAAYLGVTVLKQSGARLYRLPFRDGLLGNVHINAMHGGAIAGFLEISAQIEVLIGQRQRRVPGPIDFNIDYLRSAKSVESFVACKVLRQGSRVAQVQAHCWQTDADKPVAFARVNFLLQDQNEESA